jgi:hypothetical protein
MFIFWGPRQIYIIANRTRADKKVLRKTVGRQTKLETFQTFCNAGKRREGGGDDEEEEGGEEERGKSRNVCEQIEYEKTEFSEFS